MIPEFDENGNLPPGIHWATWDEVVERFGATPRRFLLIQGLQFDVLDIKIQQAEFLLPLDTLRRIPFTPKDLLSHRAKNSQTSSV